MNKVREMNKSIFHDNLLMTIYEILDTENLDENMFRFIILPVYEKNKSFNGLDNLMRLVALSDKNIGNRLLTIEETVKLVACKSPFVPVWINVSLNKIEDQRIIFNFETSLRFRKPSLLRNAETGHPPFKAITRKKKEKMRVISLGKENLDIELSDASYRICGAVGGGFSAFAEEIYKITEEHPMPMERRIRLANILSGVPAFSGDKLISDLRDPDFPYTTKLADIDEEEKKRVRETVCAEWERTNPGYAISFYDEEGNLLCSADCRTRVLTLSDSCLEIHMDGTIVRFDGEQQKKRFVAAASSMRWLCPEERKASAEEFDEYVRKLKAEYKTLTRKTRPCIIFADDKGKKLYSVR